MKENAYKDAGVDIDAGDEFVRRLGPHVKNTLRPGVMGGIGGFGSFFSLNDVKNYSDPVLVSSTDGVGTKLKLAFQTGYHDTVGIDCVAMCVNDIAVHGAEPLYFLDYFATGRLNVETAEKVIAGVARGCTLAGCALAGGETAEMPDMYSNDEYDLAGFTVGVVERKMIIDGQSVSDGDVILGLASDGLHSNGFSLVRKLLQKYDDKILDEIHSISEGKALGEYLLKPTRIYVRSILDCLKIKDGNGTPVIKGMAHITGGGIAGNLGRILPGGLTAEIDAANWRSPLVFDWLRKTGDLRTEDMLSTFNCGLGMILVVQADHVIPVKEKLSENESVFEIGRIRKSSDSDAESNNENGEVKKHGGVKVENADLLWQDA